MKILPITQAKDLLAAMDQRFREHSEMTISEQEFLAQMLLNYKPKKVLEVGVAAGASSVIMLQALTALGEDFTFYSADYRDEYYRDASKKTGFIVEQYSELSKKRNLFTGGYVANFLDTIGHEIDFCLIDTVHTVPGELLDFIMILPYLKKEAIVVLHDTNLHTWHTESAVVNNLLISALSGEKILPETYEPEFWHNIEKKTYTMPFENIAAVQLDGNQMEKVWDIFNLLTQKWAYYPGPKALATFKDCLIKHYDVYYQNYFNEIFEYQMKNNFKS